MPNAPIAGPRRIRPPTLPKEPSAARPPAVPLGPGSSRTLPPLDYDDTGRGRRPKSVEATQPGRRRRSNRALWFVLGIAFGAVAAVFARGDALGTLEAARAWGASTLRSLEHTPAPATPYSMTATATAASSPVVAAENAPCPVDPGAGDPCAELLAPFATSAPAARIPTVNVDDLPTAVVPVVVPVAPVVVVARRHAHGPARAGAHAPAAPAPPPAEESAATEPRPAGINPDEDGEPAGRPVKASPAAAPPAERPAADPAAELKSAKNDAM